jgi:hypothetical protein
MRSNTMNKPRSLAQCRSQLPRGLRRRFAAAHLLGLWVRMPPGKWLSLPCECCVLSGRGLRDEPITRSEESYRMCVCLIMCDLETPTVRRPRGELGCRATGKENLFSKQEAGQVNSHNPVWVEKLPFTITVRLATVLTQLSKWRIPEANPT